MTSFMEANLESLVLNDLHASGWEVAHGPSIAPGESAAERLQYEDVVLVGRLRSAILELNPDLPSEAAEDAIRVLLRPQSQVVLSENWRAYQLLTQGVPVEYRKPDGSIRSTRVRVIDWDRPTRNDLLAVNQLTIVGASERRPDVLLFVNGFPLVLIELKRPGQLNATLRGAFNQVQTYRTHIPDVFTWNQIVVISDGVAARAGTFAAPWEHYAPWKTIDGSLADDDQPQIEVLANGLLRPDVLLDLVRNFVVFSDEPAGAVKKVAKYHQYWAVNKAVARTVEATSGDGRAGVVWHTQGSGKSLEMHCYTGKIMTHPRMQNPTVVVLTDRNDLDDQLFAEVFASSRPGAPLPEAPVQATSRSDLKHLLDKRESGGIVFATIQKFGLTAKDRAAGREFPQLSSRANIVVMVDEAHRSNYDFIDGFARHLRNALPNATYIGFTGTPIEADDRNTPQVFGDYIDVYDLTQAVADGATVKVYYEARLARVELPQEALDALDTQFADATSSSEEDAREALRSRWGRVEAIVGSEDRVKALAADIVEHWETRSQVLAGKAMVVAMSRRIAVALYDAIVALRPAWHSEDDASGVVKVVITGAADDDPSLQPHIRSKQRMRELKTRAKDPLDPLQLVIVRDMWLTGFDSPSMHTMYVDKPMRGAPLMQAIARVNRTFKDKPSGLVVDYLGIAEDLKSALADYTNRDRLNGELGQDLRDRAIPGLIEKHEIVCAILHDWNWRERLASKDDRAFLKALTSTMNYLIADHSSRPESDRCGPESPCLMHRFLPQVRRLVSLFAVCVPDESAMALRDDVAFFDAVRTQINKAEGNDREGGDPSAEIDAAIKQIVSSAMSGAGVIDIYGEAGLEKPDISLIDDAFVDRFASTENPALQIEMLRRLLSDEIGKIGRRNVVAGQQFSQLLQRSLMKYQNRALDSAAVVAELADLARHLREERDRGQRVGLAEDELAFYDAIRANASAVDELPDESLKSIARELVAIVRRDAKTDWNVKEQVRAKLRTTIKRLLRIHGYPPDAANSATDLVLKQAEVMAHLRSAVDHASAQEASSTRRR